MENFIFVKCYAYKSKSTTSQNFQFSLCWFTNYFTTMIIWQWKTSAIIILDQDEEKKCCIQLKSNSKCGKPKSPKSRKMKKADTSKKENLTSTFKYMPRVSYQYFKSVRTQSKYRVSHKNVPIFLWK